MPKKFHAIAGLPRSGSTLLCNVLNQNPKFYASSTSPLPSFIDGCQRMWSKRPEITADVIRDPEFVNRRLIRCVQGIVNAWHEETPNSKAEVVFDKSRGWNTLGLEFEQCLPDSKMIVCVRDLFEIFASCEKQHQKNPVINPMIGDSALDRTLKSRANMLFSPAGEIGAPLDGLKDLIDRDVQSVYFLQYDLFVEEPEMNLRALYKFLDEPWYGGHDFDNVENTSTDVDALYWNKYPHKGCGKIEPRDPELDKYVPMYVRRDVAKRFDWFQKKFGYATVS